MKIRTLGWLVGLSAIASSFLSCTQAKLTCVVGHAGASAYVAQYFPNGAAPACAATALRPVPSLLWLALANAAANADPPDTACKADGDCNSKHCVTDPKTMMATCGPGDPPPPESLSTITGDQVGMETYHPLMTTGEDSAPDFSKGTVAMQADAVGEVAGGRDVDPASGTPFALGDWAAEYPDANDFCPVSNVKPSVQKFPKVDDTNSKMMPLPCLAPEQDFTYDWKNVQFYVTASAIGTEFSADLTYTQVDHQVDPAAQPTDAPMCTDKVAATTCTLEYHVRGVWPAISCAVTDDDGNPQVDPATGKLMIDPTQCCPDADPPARPVGSGINPDFPVKCDVNLGMCVLDAPDDAKLPIIGGNKNPVCKTSTAM